MRRTASGSPWPNKAFPRAPARPPDRERRAGPSRRAGRAEIRWRPRSCRARARCAPAGAAPGTGRDRPRPRSRHRSRASALSTGRMHHPAHQRRRSAASASGGIHQSCGRRSCRGACGIAAASAASSGSGACTRASSPLQLVEARGEERVVQGSRGSFMRVFTTASLARARDRRGFPCGPGVRPVARVPAKGASARCRCRCRTPARPRHRLRSDSSQRMSTSR